MEQLKSLADLLDLHDIDLAIDRLLDERSSLPELEKYKVAHGEVERISQALKDAEDASKSAGQALHKTNGELEIMAERAASEQNRLYAGGMSARDADYLRREVEMLYNKVSAMEDDVLRFMEDKDSSDARVAELTSELAAATTVKDELAAAIQDQWRVIDKQIAAKEERKAAAAPLVDEYYMEIYDGLREGKKGRVVGRLTDGICGSCHLQLSAAEVSRVSKDDPPRCIHCRSILVV